MKTVDIVARILKREGAEYLFGFPTTPLIESAAEVGLRPIICRQERVGVGIADGYARVTNGDPPAVFAMQYGPGAENAFAGVATAYSDGVPLLLIPQGHPRHMDGVAPHFGSVRPFGPVTKSVERLSSPDRVADTMRRAFARLRMGRPGPVMVEMPSDIAVEDVDEALLESYRPVRASVSEADPRDVLEAARALLAARDPIIIAGQGVLYANGSDELVSLAELLHVPVMTTLAGKSAFPEHHPLALGCGGSSVVTGPVGRFLPRADLVFGIGTSFTTHGMTLPIPRGKVMIHATNDPGDIDKYYVADHPLIGDARLVLRQFSEACIEVLGGKSRGKSNAAGEIAQARREWMAGWTPKLTSDEAPITPYRVIGEFNDLVDPANTIVTHDSGSPRLQLVPFYRSSGPRTYLGWGKSHGLGTGLGLTIGAKLAEPNRFCVNFMGDAAFGMTGLDFETAVRSNTPILTVVLNNSTMAIETDGMATSHRLFNTRDLGGNYADMASAMGGWSERVEDPSEVGPALARAKHATESGRPALLEFITCEEIKFSKVGSFS